MRGLVAVVLMAAVALGGAGCGGDETQPVMFAVYERWLRPPGFIEGYYAYATLRDEEGRVVGQGRSAGLEPNEPWLERRLAPGRYRIEGYVQSCAPGCAPRHADPPSHRCAAEVDIDGDTAVTFVRDRPDRCHVEIEQPPGSDAKRAS